MLSQSNIPVVEALRSFKSAGVSVAFLVPTSTGLEKAIMDATQPLRGYLREKYIHDFSTQHQGTDHSAIETILFSGGEVKSTQTSLTDLKPNQVIQEFGFTNLRLMRHQTCWRSLLPKHTY